MLNFGNVKNLGHYSTVDKSKIETIEIKPNAAANLSSEAKGSTPVSVEGNKTGKLCKHTWQGTKCQIQDRQRIHIDPCHDRECRVE